MSAPHVSGGAALLWAQNPSLSVKQVKDMLLLSGDVVSALADKTLTSRRLNIDRSLQSVIEVDSTPPGAVSNFHINSQTGRTLNVGWTAAGDDGAGGGNAALYELSFTDSTPGLDANSIKGCGACGAGRWPDSRTSQFRIDTRPALLRFENLTIAATKVRRKRFR